MSLTDFTDSTTATWSLAATLVPTAGSSTNTMSPSASWAKLLMPTVAMPLSPGRIHSWVSANLRVLMGFPCGGSFENFFAVAHERRLDDAHRVQRAAQVHLAGGGRHWNAGQGDGMAERGGK